MCWSWRGPTLVWFAFSSWSVRLHQSCLHFKLSVSTHLLHHSILSSAGGLICRRARGTWENSDLKRQPWHEAFGLLAVTSTPVSLSFGRRRWHGKSLQHLSVSWSFPSNLPIASSLSLGRWVGEWDEARVWTHGVKVRVSAQTPLLVKRLLALAFSSAEAAPPQSLV